MAKKAKPKSSKTAKPDVRSGYDRRRLALHLTGVVALVVAIVASAWTSRRHVEVIAASEKPPIIHIKDQPGWMSPTLARDIIRMIEPDFARSVFDHELLEDATLALRTSPWIKEVRSVRRVYGEQPGDTIELDIDFRTPAALVHWGDYFWLIDDEGYKLPEQFTIEQIKRVVKAKDGSINLRVIQGVANPPVEAGTLWPGDDLQAGLALLKRLHDEPYADQIVRVDVANFDGRVDKHASQLVLLTRYNTKILWGQPIDATAFYVEASAEQKLATLRSVWDEYGRIDGGYPWIDIRLDENVLRPVDDGHVADGR